MLAQLHHGGSQPGVRNAVGFDLLLKAKMAQKRPLGPRHGDINAGDRKQRIDKNDRFLDRGNCFAEASSRTKDGS